MPGYGVHPTSNVEYNLERPEGRGYVRRDRERSHGVTLIGTRDQGATEDVLKERTLTKLYNSRPTWLEQAHRRVDEAVFAAYGWPTRRCWRGCWRSTASGRGEGGDEAALPRDHRATAIARSTCAPSPTAVGEGRGEGGRQPSAASGPDALSRSPQRQKRRGAVEHPEADRHADDRQAQEVRHRHPDRRHP